MEYTNTPAPIVRQGMLLEVYEWGSRQIEICFEQRQAPEHMTAVRKWQSTACSPVDIVRQSQNMQM